MGLKAIDCYQDGIKRPELNLWQLKEYHINISGINKASKKCFLNKEEEFQEEKNGW